jgi:hypothetical protein
LATDHFGAAVAFNGDLAIVGAPQDDDRGTNFGSAYVFRWDGLTWLQETQLYASTGGTNDFFGTALAAAFAAGFGAGFGAGLVAALGAALAGFALSAAALAAGPDGFGAAGFPSAAGVAGLRVAATKCPLLLAIAGLLIECSTV